MPLSCFQSCNSDIKIHHPFKAVVLNSRCILQSSGELSKIPMPPPSSRFWFNLPEMRPSYWSFSKCLCKILSGLWTIVVWVICNFLQLLFTYPYWNLSLLFLLAYRQEQNFPKFSPISLEWAYGKIMGLSANHNKPCTLAYVIIMTETQRSDVLCPSAPSRVYACDILLHTYVCIYIYI